VFLWAGEGAWWLFTTLYHWYAVRDQHPHEASLVCTLVLIIFLFSMGLAEYKRYFIDWARHPFTASEFNQDYVKIGEEINALPAGIPKYVVVERGDVFVNGLPVSAQTTMFITKTFSAEGQREKNVTYLTLEQFSSQKEFISNLPAVHVFHLQ